jgi:hypothetical protein
VSGVSASRVGVGDLDESHKHANILKEALRGWRSACRVNQGGRGTTAVHVRGQMKIAERLYDMGELETFRIRSNDSAANSKKRLVVVKSQ